MEPTGTNQMAQLKSYRKAPAVLAGAFSVILTAITPTLAQSLCEELLAEGRFSEARMEALRDLSRDPEDYQALLVSIKSGIRLGKDLTEELQSFVADEQINQELRCEAHYELASVYESRSEPGSAIEHLVECFNKTSSSKLFASATLKANRILNDNPELEASHKELISVIRTSAATWQRQSKAEDKSPALLSLPALWAITFYRTQISPAIGARCSLTPSCSQYAVSALKTHGIMGLAITGDRMVREPGVVAAKASPIAIRHQIKYADPLSDHTFWMKEKK